MNKYLLFLQNWINTCTAHSNYPHLCFPPQVSANVINNIIHLSNELKQEDPILSNTLFQLRNNIIFPYGLNPTAFGQLYAIIDYLCKKSSVPKNNIWSYIHPMIQSVSKGQYESGYYADAVENAFKEINSRIKNILRKSDPNNTSDGSAAMQKAFSPNNPILQLNSLETESDKNIQQGFMKMADGAMNALRNPKAHANLIIAADDAMRQLILASMLMYKIDEGIVYSNIKE